jgi:protein SCO1/2
MTLLDQSQDPPLPNQNWGTVVPEKGSQEEMKVKLGYLGVGVLVGLALLLGGWVFYNQTYTFKGALIDPPVPAADFELNDQYGQPFRLSDQVGEVVLIFFGYTHCPDVCPVTMAEYMRVKARLGEQANQVRFVFITVDPERDTREVLQAHLNNFDPTFTALTGERAELEKVWRSYGVYQGRNDSLGGSSYLVDHTSRVYAIDKSGNWRLTYEFGTETDKLFQDVAYLLRE